MTSLSPNKIWQHHNNKYGGGKKTYTIVDYYKKKNTSGVFSFPEYNFCSFQLIFKTYFKGMSKVYIV